jgi:hypothetical protein
VARPSEPFTWATDAVFDDPGKPWDGLPTRGEPAAGRQASGFLPGERTPAPEINHLLGVTADHLEWLHNVTSTAVGGGEAVDLVYETPPTRTVHFHPSRGLPTTSSIAWGFDQTSVRRELESRLDKGFVNFDLEEAVPSGATITRVRALVDPGAARAVAGDRVTMTLIQFTPDFTPPVSVPTTNSQFSVTDDGSTNLQLVTSGVFAMLVDKSTTYSVLQIRSGSDGGTNRDKLYSLEVQFTDPGPRNF